MKIIIKYKRNIRKMMKKRKPVYSKRRKGKEEYERNYNVLIPEV